MIGKLNHIGIAVESLAQARDFYEQVLGLPGGEIEEVPEQQVRVLFFTCGDTRIELLEPTSPDSPIARALATRGPGVHHLAYEPDDLPAERARLRERGGRVVAEQPRRGAHGTLIAFVHPKESGKVLTELTQPLGSHEA